MRLPDNVVNELAAKLYLDRGLARSIGEGLGSAPDTPDEIRRWAQTRGWAYNEARSYLERARRVLAECGYPADPLHDPNLLLEPPYDDFQLAELHVESVQVDHEGSPHERIRVQLSAPPWWTSPDVYTYSIGAPHYEEVKRALEEGGTVTIWNERHDPRNDLRIWQLRKDGRTVVHYQETAKYYGRGRNDPAE